MKKILAAALLIALTFAASVPARAGTPIIITDQNLDEILFKGNTDTMGALNMVMKAKDQVSLSRAGLLPSLNLNFNATMSTTASPLFMLNSASCLVPFIFPSKWLELKASNKNFGAEVSAMHITRLNVYAIAYALASRIAGDEAALDVLNDQYNRAHENFAEMDGRYRMAVISEEQFRQAEMELGKIRSDLGRMRDGVAASRAQLRKAFGLPLSQDFIIAVGDVPASRLEIETPAGALPTVMRRAPERRQLDLMLEGAIAQRQATTWSFLAGCSGGQGGVGQGQAFSVSNGALVDFGFGYFPKVRIAERGEKVIKLRMRELKLEMGAKLETALTAVLEGGTRVSLAAREVEIAEGFLKDKQEQFIRGAASFDDVLVQNAAVTRTKIELVNLQANLAGHRVTLRRIGLEGRFMNVYEDSKRELEIEDLD